MAENEPNVQSIPAQALEIFFRWLIGYNGDPGLLERAKRRFSWWLGLGVLAPIVLTLMGIFCSHFLGWPTAARVVIAIGIVFALLVVGIVGSILVVGAEFIIKL